MSAPGRHGFRLVELHRPRPNRLEALVVRGRNRRVLWFEGQDGVLREQADAFLPVLLPAAMAAGAELQIEVPVDPELLAAAQRVGRLLATWHPSWSEISPIATAGSVSPASTAASTEAPTSAPNPAPGKRASFFSGGLDSFRTLQRHGPALDQLLFVHGFDIPLHATEKAEAVQRSLALVAEEVGIDILTVRTNLRAFTDAWVAWDHHQCGSALAAVAHLLAPRFRQVLIPSSYPFAFLSPYGSHPGLDPLWSTPGLELLHDGCEEGRWEKVEALASWPLARQQLRVCWQPNSLKPNCGHCRKCLVTHALLRARCGDHPWPAFPAPLPLAALERVKVDGLDMRHRLLQARDHLHTTGADPALLRSLSRLLQPRAPQRLARTLQQQKLGWLAKLRG
ncbi:MAG: hypothetical protein ACK5JJ_02075 [Cyanobacteriota bacterium]|jgi:hypothetical protein